jgi:hypothetical protein
MLRQGNIKLIGEPFPDLQLGPAPGGVGQVGPAGFLAQQLAAAVAWQQIPPANPAFARIYGFSFEGHYYDLPKPVVMMVTGAGVPVGAPTPTIGQSDEAGRLWDFSTQLFAWNYDKLTVTIRLDIESGTLEQILLEPALSGTGWSYAGAKAGIGGAKVGLGGAKAGISGAKAGISGAKAGIRGDGWGD